PALYSLSLHDALPIWAANWSSRMARRARPQGERARRRAVRKARAKTTAMYAAWAAGLRKVRPSRDGAGTPGMPMGPRVRLIQLLNKAWATTPKPKVARAK